ncbi:MAG: MEDS domain-containing protein [Thermoleophilia bacterium]|nr:MEDS domain-containing protein [Thermoleophilia bacterium]
MDNSDKGGKLLTIREAAAFLSVSVMSVRRWTNAGTLKCYRVGSKDERRFRMEDLQAFIEGHRPAVPLGIGGLELEGPAHISHFYRTEDESLDVGLAYVKQGLDLGELILVVAPEPRQLELLGRLEDLGAIVPVLLDQKILTMSSGLPTPEAQGAMVDDLLRKAKRWNGFRLLGDMVWTKAHRWGLETLAALESLTNRQRPGKQATFLCQYCLDDFSRDTAFMAMQTHDHTLYHGRLNASPYYGM